MASLYDLEMGNVTVGVDYEAACHSALYSFLVGILRIFSVFIDVVEESLPSSWERRFHINEIVFENFLISVNSVGVGHCHTACLSRCVARKQ